MESLDYNKLYQTFAMLGIRYKIDLFGTPVLVHVQNRKELTDEARHPWMAEHNCWGRVSFPAVRLYVERLPGQVVRPGQKDYEAIYELLTQQMNAAMNLPVGIYQGDATEQLRVYVEGHAFVMTAFEKWGAAEAVVFDVMPSARQ